MLTQEKLDYWTKNFELIATENVTEDILDTIENEINQLSELEINELAQWLLQTGKENSAKTAELLELFKKSQKPNE